MPKRSRSAPVWPGDGYLRVHCPRCDKGLKIPPEYDGKKCRCPRCDESLLIVMPSLPTQPPSLSGKPRPFVAPIPPAVYQPKPTPTPRQPEVKAAKPPPLPPPAAPEPATITEFIEDTDEHEHYKPARYEPQTERDERRPSGGLSVKWTYRFFLILFSIPLLTLIWLPIIRRLIFHMATACACLLTSTFQCPGCQLVYPARTIWKCSCGFQPHYEKHILAFVCRLCGNRIGHTTCERCGTTIFVR